MLNDLPWKQTELFLPFLRLHPSTAFQTLLLIMRDTPFLLRDTCPFCFDPYISFFLKILVVAPCFSPVAYWTPFNLGDSSFTIIFLAFYTVHGIFMVSILGWFAIPSSSGSHFVRNLYYYQSILGGPAWHVS